MPRIAIQPSETSSQHRMPQLQDPPRILFVCLGNICRSPAAEGVFVRLAQEAGLAVVVDSCGTSDWHVGQAPYAPMQAAAKARGYDLSALKARQIRLQDFGEFDLVLAMDADNLAGVQSLRPANARARLQLLMEYAPEAGVEQVPDPYYSRDFDQTIDLVEQAAQGLIRALTVRRDSQLMKGGH